MLFARPSHFAEVRDSGAAAAPGGRLWHYSSVLHCSDWLLQLTEDRGPGHTSPSRPTLLFQIVTDICTAVTTDNTRQIQSEVTLLQLQ